MPEKVFEEGKKIPIGTICTYCGSGHPIGKEREFEGCFGENVKLPIKDFRVAAKIADAKEKFEKEATFENFDPYFALLCPACGTVVGVVTKKELNK
jgi:ssDNA-binding Zn-finger/Zn-ribbon topoisomerase 1